MGKEDVAKVDADIARFLEHKTLEGYIQDKNETFANADHWNTAKGLQLKTYFNKNKDETFKKIGRWKLEEMNIIKPYKGITNNAAESLNSQFSNFKTSRRDAQSIDDLVLELFYFEKMIGHQVEAGYHNHGPFEVKDNFRHLAKDPKDLPSSFEFNPQQIRDQVKAILEAKQTAEMEMPATIGRSDEGVVSKLAKEIVENNLYNVSYVDGSTLCTVKLNDETFAANITNKTCSCKSTSCCSHLLAGLVVTGHAVDFKLPETKPKATEKTKLKVPGKRATIHGSKKPMKHDLTSSAIHPKGIIPMKDLPPLVEPKAGMFTIPEKMTIPDDDQEMMDIEEVFDAVVRVSSTESDGSQPKVMTHPNATELKEFFKRLHVGQTDIIEVDGDYHAIKMTGNGEVCIITNTKDFVKKDYFHEIEKKAADAVAHTAKLGEKFYEIKIAVLQTKKDLVQKSDELKDTRNLKDFLKVHTLHCKCGRIVGSRDANVVKCTDCKQSFHKDCVPGTKCTPCNSPVQGLKWSEGIYYNTCTVDNHLTVVADHIMTEDPDFQKHFNSKKCTKEEKRFGEAVQLTVENKSAEAHNLYGVFISKKLNNKVIITLQMVRL